MKILVVSDLHDHKLETIVPKEILDNIDFIISAGDYQENYPYPKEAIGVYGNHDTDPGATLITVNHKMKEYKGMTFMGIEGVFCGEKRYHNPKRKRSHHQLESEVKGFLEHQPRVTFFITHSRADNIFNRYTDGSKAFRQYIEDKQPVFYISGHCSHPDKTMMIGKTICINPHGNLWDYVVLTLPEKKVEFYVRGRNQPI